MNFRSKITDGKIDLYVREAIGNFVKQYEGKEVDIEINKAKRKRSNPQNRHLWGIVYKTISDFTGYTVDEVHALCKEKFNPQFIKLTNKITGEETEEKIAGSTTKMTTVDFMEYVQKIQVFFAELGCVISDPNQNEWTE